MERNRKITSFFFFLLTYFSSEKPQYNNMSLPFATTIRTLLLVLLFWMPTTSNAFLTIPKIVKEDLPTYYLFPKKLQKRAFTSSRASSSATTTTTKIWIGKNDNDNDGTQKDSSSSSNKTNNPDTKKKKNENNKNASSSSSSSLNNNNNIITIEDWTFLSLDLLAILVSCELLGLVDDIVLKGWSTFFNPIDLDSFSTLPLLVRRDSILSSAWIVACARNKGYDYNINYYFDTKNNNNNNDDDDVSVSSTVTSTILGSFAEYALLLLFIHIVLPDVTTTASSTTNLLFQQYYDDAPSSQQGSSSSIAAIIATSSSSLINTIDWFELAREALLPLASILTFRLFYASRVQPWR
mmetsp:Transcript_4180/g.6448  ORF Transcript_4180/g.6448 Transcript_4180/m.6448 type:complete len:352 (+) Transcript_4180:137-1192(+)